MTPFQCELHRVVCDFPTTGYVPEPEPRWGWIIAAISILGGISLLDGCRAVLRSRR